MHQSDGNFLIRTYTYTAQSLMISVQDYNWTRPICTRLTINKIC